MMVVTIQKQDITIENQQLETFKEIEKEDHDALKSTPKSLPQKLLTLNNLHSREKTLDVADTTLLESKKSALIVMPDPTVTKYTEKKID